QRIVWPDVEETKNRIDLSEKVGVREHYPLGIGSRARRVKQRGHILRRRLDGVKLPWPRGEHAVEITDPTRLVVIFLQVCWIGENELYLEPGDRLLRDRQVLDVGDEQRSVAILEQFADLVGVKGRIERDGGVTCGDRSQI